MSANSMIQLALKHRQNKSQRQRIIVFTCSPVAEDAKALVKLAKKMKKNNVSIDFIQIGELSDVTTEKLKAFNDNVKGSEGSHLVSIPPGPYLLSDQLLSTPIFEGGAGSGAPGADGGSGGADASSFEFGIDPSVDPELALALRMSMEEEKSRVDRQAKEQAEKDKAQLPEIKEEEEALLTKDGEPSEGKDAKKDDDDKMDTA